MTELQGHPIKGIIYDLDGTLASSTLNFKAMREHVGCPLGSDLLNFIEAMEDKATKEQALQMIVDNEWQDALTATALPGAQELISWCNQKNIPQAIVTRNNEQAAKRKVQQCKLDINWVISREHFPPKPDPTSLLHIANTWQLEPSSLIYVGDFKYDIQGAHNARMKSVLVNAKQPNDFAHTSDFEYKDINTFLNHLK